MSTSQLLVILAVSTVGALVCAWQVRRALRDAEARTRTALTPPAPDNQPGTNLADLDECRRILACTDDLDAGYTRLWDAIHEHREEEGKA